MRLHIEEKKSISFSLGFVVSTCLVGPHFLRSRDISYEGGWELPIILKDLLLKQEKSWITKMYHCHCPLYAQGHQWDRCFLGLLKLPQPRTEPHNSTIRTELWLLELLANIPANHTLQMWFIVAWISELPELLGKWNRYRDFWEATVCVSMHDAQSTWTGLVFLRYSVRVCWEGRDSLQTVELSYMTQILVPPLASWALQQSGNFPWVIILLSSSSTDRQAMSIDICCLLILNSTSTGMS